jgi:hypothetical protein
LVIVASIFTNAAASIILALGSGRMVADSARCRIPARSFASQTAPATGLLAQNRDCTLCFPMIVSENNLT